MARGDQITAVDYNTIRSKIVSILGTGTGQRGYGQPLFSSPVNPGTEITAAQWDALRIDISNTKLHQDGTLPPAINVARGQIIGFGAGHPNTNYDTLSEQTILAKFNIATSQAVLSTKATKSRTGTWTTQLQAILTVTFNGGYTVTNQDTTTFTASGADHARHFFNSGGKIRFVSTRTGGTVTPQNNAWTNLLSTVGTQEFGAITPAITNFYTLTNSYQTFYQLGSSNPYLNNFYRLEALCNCTGADNSTGTANVVTFRITWQDDHIALGTSSPQEKTEVGGFPTYPNVPSGPTGFGPDSVDGTFEIIVSEFKAAGILLQGGNFSIVSPNIYSLSEISAT
jgi:hypothetical protein